MGTKIAFIGATGMLGEPVARELAKADYEVHALVRNISAARKKLPSDIQCMEGDIRDIETLRNFLSGHDRLYINLNLQREEGMKDFHAETDGLANIISAAKTNAIKRIGFISSVVMNYQGMNNFNWWVFDLKHKAVEQIRSSGIPYTIFYPSTFMENFLTTYRMGNRILLAGESKQKMHFISAIDFGRQVARAMLNTSAENLEYVVQGVNGYTADEAARIFKDNYTESKLTISKAPLGLIKFFGLFSNAANYGAHIIEALNNYPERFEAERTWKDLGKPTITLADFAARKTDR